MKNIIWITGFDDPTNLKYLDREEKELIKKYQVFRFESLLKNSLPQLGKIGHGIYLVSQENIDKKLLIIFDYDYTVEKLVKEIERENPDTVLILRHSKRLTRKHVVNFAVDKDITFISLRLPDIIRKSDLITREKEEYEINDFYHFLCYSENHNDNMPQFLQFGRVSSESLIKSIWKRISPYLFTKEELVKILIEVWLSGGCPLFTTILK